MVYHETLATPSQPANTGVFTFYASTTINAPAPLVWSILADFSSYEKWNAYTPTITTPTGTNAVKPGDMITLAYRPEPTGSLMDVPCRILEVNNREMSMAHRGCVRGILGFMLLAEKVQKVKEVEGGGCVFEIWETQGNLLAWAVKWMLCKKLQRMVEGVAEGLRRYAEEMKVEGE